MNACKIDEKQSPRYAFKGPLDTLSLAHKLHEHVVLRISQLMRDIRKTGLTNWLIIPYPSSPHTPSFSQISPRP